MTLGNQKELYINSFLENRVADIKNFLICAQFWFRKIYEETTMYRGVDDKPYTIIQFKFLLQK
jgi:hypothetical protein